jgi:hypothetical protein
VVSEERDDPRADLLVRHLAVPLDGTAAARERMWSRLVARRRPTRRSGVLPAFAAVAVALLILIAGAWLQSYRIEVGHPGTNPDNYGPFIYRREIVRVPLSGGADGALVVNQRHIDELRRGRLSVVLEASVMVASTPAAIELRYRESGSAITQVLVRKTTDGGDRALDAVVPMPERDRGDVRSYDVWLHLESAAAPPTESAVVTIEVTERPEGQRARLVGVR